jgi:hypothetical protein
MPDDNSYWYYEKERLKKSITWIYLGTITALAALCIAAYATSSVFFKDGIISIAVVSIIYLFRDKLIYSWQGALLASIGWLMNMSGTLGAYELQVFGLGWDKLLHFTSMLGITLLTYAYLRHHGLHDASLLKIGVIVFLMAQGFGAINEVAEFIGSEYFGVGQGLFGMMNGMSEPVTNLDIYDTHWDMVMNTLAIMAGLLYIAVKRRTAVPTAAPAEI